MSDPALKTEPMDKWFVWTKTGRRPSYVHESRAAAEAEAARLAALNPGKKFIVMHAVGKISVAPAALSAPVGRG